MVKLLEFRAIEVPSGEKITLIVNDFEVIERNANLMVEIDNIPEEPRNNALRFDDLTNFVTVSSLNSQMLRLKTFGYLIKKPKQKMYQRQWN
uniref:Recep_L_domain domain-containing protein n=1 Tax=Strongyloides papillosus TaxID=174720 RepID=A0A0N5BZM6_STREA